MNLDFQLGDLRLFCVAARRSSFAATASELGVSPAFVSKRIAILEGALGVKLFHRATRRVTVTLEGEQVYESAQRIFDDVDQMGETVASGRQEPRGVLRITTSVRLGRLHIAPALSLLAQRYPRLDISLDAVDRRVDLLRENVDLDIRVGDVDESHLVSHRIAPSTKILCAAPSYLARRGVPQTLAELAQHECLVLREGRLAFGVWQLNGPNGAEKVKVSGKLSSNNAEFVRGWAEDGHGILFQTSWDVHDALQSGQLVRVLGTYAQPADICAASTVRLSHSAKVRVCVAFLQAHLGEGGARALPG